MGLLDDISPNGRGSFILLGFIIFLIALILWRPADFQKMGKQRSPVTQPKPAHVVEQSNNLTGSIRRVSHVERGGDFIEDLFFMGDHQIANQRIEKGVMVSHEGQAISSVVKFFNEIDQTYGEAEYLNNLRHGLSTTYFPDGKVILEEYY